VRRSFDFRSEIAGKRRQRWKRGLASAAPFTQRGRATEESAGAFLQPPGCCAFNFQVIQRFKGKAFFMTKKMLAKEVFCTR
jgi:hypothetical protein